MLSSVLRGAPFHLLLLLAVAGCGTDERFVGPDVVGNASFEARASVGQVFVTHASPGATLELTDFERVPVATGEADEQGSLVFRNVPPGRQYLVWSGEEYSDSLAVLSVEESQPPQAFYASQKLQPGFGYITVRDGTKLSAYVTLPGPPEAGPYPTIINYSGYDPSKPGKSLGAQYEALCPVLPALCDAPTDASALIAALMGYATVSVNMRGTGCSGGAYDFFEPLQLLDGYDVVEIVAAQGWVKHHHVGMTGLSYPGITQLFVAKTRPPSLAAITPLSVIGNTVSTLVPGGILNDGFAISWAKNVLDKADPYGQGWEEERVAEGDTICEENQLLHSQKVDIIQKAYDNPFYTDEVAAPLNPTEFVDEIEIPVFLASSFQDEQTGPFFFTLLDRFERAPVRKFTIYNGVHPDAFNPRTLLEWKTFLDLYVSREVPFVDGAVRLMAPMLFQEIYKAQMQLPPDRFAKVDGYEAARAMYEAEPELSVLFENGSKEPLGSPQPSAELRFASFPPAATEPRRWYFQPDGALGEALPPSGGLASRWKLDPEAGQRGILAPGANVWDLLPGYDWRQPEPGMAVSFVSAPLSADLVMLGSGSVDLHLRANVADADLEVNLSELRPDGQEMFVQSGWLRASHAALAPDATELWPEHTYREKDLKPLVPGEWSSVRVGLAAFSHVFRKGSRIRILVDTPGDSRADWRFNLKKFPAEALYDVAHSAERPSSIVLPVLAGVAAPSGLPPCPSLRGQQCREYAAYENQPAP